MKVRRWLLLLMLVGILPTPAQADRVVPSNAGQNRVDIHGRARADSPVIGQLRINEPLEFVRSVPRWFEVRLANGQTGFVPKSRTRVIRDLATRRDDELRVHFLNVGAGSCVLVEFPGRNNPPPLIVDCGSLAPTPNSMDRDEAQAYIKEVLQGRPVNVVLSHADRDHYGWISTVLDGVSVRNIWQGGDHSQYTSDSFPAWITGRIANGAVQHPRFSPNFHNNDNPLDARVTGDASAFVLTVNAGESKNGQSLVLEIVYQDFNVVFTGDAEGDTEQQIRDNYDDNVKATVMTGSHHGARTHGSNGAGWVQATSPALVIFSAGRSFGHPQCDAVRRFEGIVARVAAHPTQCGRGSRYDPVRTTSAAVYVTELNGRVVLTSNGRSPFRLFCTGSVGCDAQISH